MIQSVVVAGEEIVLLPERAVWWPARKALIVADIHWAKSGHFRKHGLAMPAGIQAADGLRLAKLVRQYQAERLIVAGDFFHSHYNAEVDDFSHWRRQHPDLHLDFIRGNHDMLAPEFYRQWNFHTYETGLEIGPFYITHDAVEKPGSFTIYGHLHPGLRLGGGRPLPCFCFTKDSLLLPAFGSFTGFKIIAPANYSQVYVAGEGKVLQLK